MHGSWGKSFQSVSMYLVYGAHQQSTTDSTDLLNEHKMVQANLKTKHKSKTRRKERRKNVKEGKAVAEQGEGMTELYIHDVFLPGWVWCRLHCRSPPEHRRRSRRPRHSPEYGSMHSQQEERGRQERSGMPGSIRGREVMVRSNEGWWCGINGRGVIASGQRAHKEGWEWQEECMGWVRRKRGVLSDRNSKTLTVLGITYSIKRDLKGKTQNDLMLILH